MNMRRRTAVAGLLVTAVLLSACGPDGDTVATSTVGMGSPCEITSISHQQTGDILTVTFEDNHQCLEAAWSITNGKPDSDPAQVIVSDEGGLPPSGVLTFPGAVGSGPWYFTLTVPGSSIADSATYSATLS